MLRTQNAPHPECSAPRMLRTQDTPHQGSVEARCRLCRQSRPTAIAFISVTVRARHAGAQDGRAGTAQAGAGFRRRQYRPRRGNLRPVRHGLGPEAVSVLVDSGSAPATLIAFAMVLAARVTRPIGSSAAGVLSEDSSAAPVMRDSSTP